MANDSGEDRDGPPRPGRIRALIDRLARVAASEAWQADLNPAQAAALAYLARANRFSRAPSAVAEYLGATRGTVSQTLKALRRKGLVHEVPSESDRRSLRYDVTGSGRARLAAFGAIDSAIEALPEADAAALERRLEDVLLAALSARGFRTFGQCRTCAFHRPSGNGARCALLDVPLRPHEAEEICAEHTSPRAGQPGHENA